MQSSCRTCRPAVAVVGIPAKAVQPHKKMGEFVAYGTPDRQCGPIRSPARSRRWPSRLPFLQERLVRWRCGEAQKDSLGKPLSHGSDTHVVVDNDRMDDDRLAAGG